MLGQCLPARLASGMRGGCYWQGDCSLLLSVPGWDFPSCPVTVRRPLVPVYRHTELSSQGFRAVPLSPARGCLGPARLENSFLQALSRCLLGFSQPTLILPDPFEDSLVMTSSAPCRFSLNLFGLHTMNLNLTLLSS